MFFIEINLKRSFSDAVNVKRGTGVGNCGKRSLRIHTPELTTLGVSAKGWIRHPDGMYLLKTGRREAAASLLLDALQISHIEYTLSKEDEIAAYLSDERKIWMENVGGASREIPAVHQPGTIVGNL